MDPIGLAFENFDAIGRYRDTENGQPIDVSGEIHGTQRRQPGRPVQRRARARRQARRERPGAGLRGHAVVPLRCRTQRGRTPDACSLATLQDTFFSSGGDLVELLVGMTQTDAFWYRAPVTP